MIAIVVNMNRKIIELIQFVTFFQNLSIFSIGLGARAETSGKMMRLLALRLRITDRRIYFETQAHHRRSVLYITVI
jgi:hypothetical protein